MAYFVYGWGGRRRQHDWDHIENKLTIKMSYPGKMVKKKKCKKAKWLSEEVFQIAVKRREAKSKGEKERYIHLNAEFQRITRRDKKVFLSD